MNTDTMSSTPAQGNWFRVIVALAVVTALALLPALSHGAECCASMSSKSAKGTSSSAELATCAKDGATTKSAAK